eukprot:CAMPEP_0117535924 /NCGR_PEP_ID=MMETSP0784-20121206/41184_1 /TAXON_ID=39447 /ORGANISM="" /LENGTH=51 /DNA_ID=CAMNT_0005332463 /DNA_START=24 /DNA_END=179 /DNA_ORIENTATION=-
MTPFAYKRTGWMVFFATRFLALPASICLGAMVAACLLMPPFPMASVAASRA